METNEIKKELYKQNPVAELVSINKTGIRYECDIWESGLSVKVVTFTIPFDDIGDAVFIARMDAKFLIRYLIV